MSVVTLVMASVLFASCSSDNGEGEDDEGFQTGVYKVEVSLSGDTDLFVPSVAFTGIESNGKASKVYDASGNEYELQYIMSGSDTPFTEVSSYSSSSCQIFYASIVFLNYHHVEGDVTVKCKGYLNNKLIKTGESTYHISSDDVSIAANFDCGSGLILLTD